MLFWMWNERRPQRRHRVCDLVWRRPKLPVPCKTAGRHAMAEHTSHATAAHHEAGQQRNGGSGDGHR